MHHFHLIILLFDMFRKKFRVVILLIAITILLGILMTYVKFYQPRTVPCFQVTLQHFVSTTNNSNIRVSGISGHQFEKRRRDSCSKHNHAAFLKSRGYGGQGLGMECPEN
ncbi:hypothetical protein CHS0354_015785 [Potamilus streckersoni]|uniref:Uncharacterized protein n=1 Tax=Potamilus streckersoni TaxID=2493646 RepID=A0AAE0RQA1_9BIVA|nr:hypothetical protein CHS0354_015785 [Potamilus streckersoni]